MAFLWVSNKLRDTKDYMVDKIENTSGYISREGSRVFNGITGKATFLEAEKLYREIEEEYTRKNNEYKKKISDIGKEIEEIDKYIQNYIGISTTVLYISFLTILGIMF